MYRYWRVEGRMSSGAAVRAEKAAAAVCGEVGGGSEVEVQTDRQTDNRETEREVTGALQLRLEGEASARREAGARWCAG
jgi:hypothetical protein